MTSMWKRLRVSKKATKFQFVASYQDLVVECTEKWQPDKLRVVWMRRNRRVCSQLHSWLPGITNPHRGMVVWSMPENLEISATLFKRPDADEFEDKEWTFVVESEDKKGHRKALASAYINLKRFACPAHSPVDLTLKLRPLSAKVVEATLQLSLACFSVREGKSTDEDMQSLASLMSNKPMGIANFEDFDESIKEEDGEFMTAAGLTPHLDLQTDMEMSLCTVRLQERSTVSLEEEVGRRSSMKVPPPRMKPMARGEESIPPALPTCQITEVFTSRLHRVEDAELVWKRRSKSEEGEKDLSAKENRAPECQAAEESQTPPPQENEEEKTASESTTASKSPLQQEDELKVHLQDAGEYVQTQLEVLEEEQRRIDLRAAVVEKVLRRLMATGRDRDKEEQLTQEWLTLVNKRSSLVRRLDYLRLLRHQEELETRFELRKRELRVLATVEDCWKTKAQRWTEHRLTQELVSLVDQRDQVFRDIDATMREATEEELSLRRGLELRQRGESTVKKQLNFTMRGFLS